MIIYRERVLPSLGVAVLPVLLFLTVVAIMVPLNAQLAIPVALLMCLAFVTYIYFSAPVIEVTENTLSARGATIHRKYLGESEIIPKELSFEELGRKLDARAWLSIQASVKGLVKIEVTDPKDPTPYWMLSTRKPEALINALSRN